MISTSRGSDKIKRKQKRDGADKALKHLFVKTRSEEETDSGAQNGICKAKAFRKEEINVTFLDAWSLMVAHDGSCEPCNKS